MFPRTEIRLKTMLRRSLDAAIDFATLGEYGYAPAWEGPDAAEDMDWGFDSAWAQPQAGAWAQPQAGVATIAAPERTIRRSAPAAELLEPASAAGRARRNAERRAAPSCAGQPVRGRALTPQAPRAARQRDGMAQRPQHCVADAVG